MNYFSPIINLSRIALDFIYPPVCLICKEVIREENPQNPRVAVCPVCWNNLEIEEKPYCSECKLDLDISQTHNCPIYLDRVYSLGMFDENFQEMIHHFKYKNKISLGKKLGQRLAEELQRQNLSDFTCLIPVPLHKTRKRERGFNQSEILAETLAGHLNLSIPENFLVRIRNTKDQTKLSETERKQNVAGAFQVRDTERILTGKKVILVDDVITTGATLNECAKVLKQAGVTEILAVTIAKAS